MTHRIEFKRRAVSPPTAPPFYRSSSRTASVNSVSTTVHCSARPHVPRFTVLVRCGRGGVRVLCTVAALPASE
jgi:hypothetical protein